MLFVPVCGYHKYVSKGRGFQYILIYHVSFKSPSVCSVFMVTMETQSACPKPCVFNMRFIAGFVYFVLVVPVCDVLSCQGTFSKLEVFNIRSNFMLNLLWTSFIALDCNDRYMLFSCNNFIFINLFTCSRIELKR